MSSNGINAMTSYPYSMAGYPSDLASLMNDPYFLQLYAANSSKGSTNTANSTNTATGTTSTQADPYSPVNFRANAKPAKKNNTGAYVASGIGAVVLGTGVYIFTRGKSGKGIWNQLKTGFDDIKNNGLFKKAKDEVLAWKDKILLRERNIGGTPTRMVNIPGEVRTLNSGDALLRQMDIPTTITRAFDDTANIRATGFEASFKHGTETNKVIVKDGKLFALENGSGDDIMSSYSSNADFKKAVDEFVEKVLKRDKGTINNPDYALKNLDYEYAIDDILYQCRAASVGSTGAFQAVKTNRYLATEDKVSTLLANLDDDARKALRNYIDNGRTKELKEAVVEMTHSGDKWRFINGEPVAFYNGSRWVEKGVAGDIDVFNAKIMSSDTFKDDLLKAYSKASGYDNPIYELVR